MANKPIIKSFYADSGTLGDGITNANVITLSGTADANSSVKVYDGSTLLGTVTTNSSGIWLFETPKLSDTTHSLTATATDTAGTSAASDPMSVKVVASVTDFRPASDNWSNPIQIDGQGWFVENGNKAWSLTNPDTHTVRMEVRPGDLWADDETARSEILTVTNALDHQVFNASFTMTIEPGQINPVAWLSLAQMHEDAGIPFSINIVGDKMTILTDQNADWGGLAYEDPNPIIRGHAYDIQIKANFSTDATGFLQVWRDGILIVDYHGQLGSETGGQYLKMGIYEGWAEQVQYPLAVDYSNIVVQFNNPNVATPSGSGGGNTGGGTGGGSTPPSAPTIATFSTDSGVAGDRITNDNTLTLSGTAAANSTVKVFDGSTQVGTATANASGAWSLTTSTLANGGHSLTATATNSGGTSSASTTLSVTVDTVAPTAPTISASTPASNRIEVLTGTAEANSTVKIFDGSTQIGTATANGNGAWTYTTTALSAGSHSFTAKAMDAAGNTGSASSAAAVTISAGPAPSAPTIATFSRDTGVAGDNITNDNTLTLTGTAAANSTVKVFDGGKQIGTATANSNGAWSYTTSALSDAAHVLTATATDAAGQSSGASSALSITVDTRAPVAPTITASTAAASLANNNIKVLTGTAEANSTIKVYDGTTQIGTATANGNGAWTYTAGTLTDGSHSFTAKAMDAAGNTGSASTVLSVSVSAPTMIESTGTTSLIKAGNTYYLGSNGPTLKYAGADYVAGQFGAIAPVAVEQTSTGYVVAWKVPNKDQYVVWTTDANGNQIANVTGTVSGTSAALQGYETALQQDINGDGNIGLAATTIESFGSTNLVKAGSNYLLGSNGPTLKYAGADFVAGQFGSTTPIAVEQTSTGYVVVWKAGNNQYVVWTTDANGNQIANVTGAISGNSDTLKGYENTLHQDLNGDGTIGTPATTIESFGSTSLVQSGNNYLLGNGGPTLKYAGADFVAGQFGSTTPIAVEQMSTGYLVAWKAAGNQYVIWSTDANGNQIANVTGAISGNSDTLKGYENTLHQDLNGDGTIGTPATTSESFGSTSLVQSGNNYLLGNGGPTLKYAGADFVAGQFGSTTPIAVEQMSTGYLVAWKAAGNQYVIWSTDANGNQIANVTGTVAGNSATLKGYENTFHQDLNGDGAISAPVISASALSAGNVTASVLDVTDLSVNSANMVTVKGTGAANSQISIYDGAKAVGMTQSDANGAWSFTSSASSNEAHSFMAKQLDSAGQVVASSGSAILGTANNDTLVSTGGNDVFKGNGGSTDTFVFAANFGRDVIQNFEATGSAHDVIQFSKTDFDSFASVLADASQVGADVVIKTGFDTLTLKNTALSHLDSHDFRFA
ncbi:Ig-like domain-containing protein [Bradyrhizobium sp.]|uniref:Ig-like domain-containing protein n=1 Tax=Bradyrhizobium sp. TaxID=376 RepID=UPI002B8CC3BF|nr:Ig-like domain-containing protein [Bradyrhizobium sp.]HMM88335.1 Ig-like domain-containing protein [Bradyrhizobium sp.]